MKKEVNLWVLVVDNSDGIVYTGYSKEIVENFKSTKESFKNYKVIELKGEIDV